VFHILDSLSNSYLGKKEAKQLQNILLQHFPDVNYEEGRIAASIPQVILLFFFSVCRNLSNQMA